MTAVAGPAKIGVIGGSWRAEYYLRAARELPEQFSVEHVLVRSDSSAQRVHDRWSVSTTTSELEFLAGEFDFVVICVPPDQATDLIRAVSTADIAVLSETPPAASVDALFELYRSLGGARIQVAEQYQFQPHHAGRLALAAAGRIGDVSSARVSVAHGYHGISLLRLALGVGFEPARISAAATLDPVVSARGRDAWNESPRKYDAGRTQATLQFGAKTGFYDFNFEQYFSPIRSRHIDLYGDTGEINDDRVSYLASAGHAAHDILSRESTGVDGDLEGFYLRSISLGEFVAYENRFPRVRLNDDELAVAEVLFRMVDYVRNGRAFYPLADASQDQYLSLLLNRSAETAEVVQTEETPWASSESVAIRG